MSLSWADPMPEGGRVADSAAALIKGRMLVCDALMSCPQTLHITLFFDGTNNNDLQTNPFRDSLGRTHTNVARLYNAALDKNEQGIFAFYIPGVGTPFKEIGEQVYTTSGKSMATGFGSRCVWGYTRVLNAIYNAIASDKTRNLIPDGDANRVCTEVADGHKLPLVGYTDRLGLAHKQAIDEGRYPQTVKQIWINVIGFSRGAACARVFVNKLINEWASNGRIGYQTGRYALNYKVNFVGLFDTVASVGPPDSTRATVDFGTFDGHFAFADDGRLDIPKDVRFCYHAFSTHEQRMSFPLDSIRNGDSYGGGVREEVAYPGVHSDVGGGYAPNEQGKGGATSKVGDDSHKLSQIPLHDMYLKAAKYGVPLRGKDDFDPESPLGKDFALDPSLIAAFNAWRKTVDNVSSVEDALKIGLGQMLAWRTLRAEIGNPQRYVTGQAFFKRAHEDKMTPHKVQQALPRVAENDATMSKLKSLYQLLQANAMTSSIGGYASYMSAQKEQATALDNAMNRRNEQLCGAIAHPGIDNPKPARPGEGPLDVSTNDQTDLRQGAEEMRLLLGHLYPDQCERWQVKRTQHPPVIVPGGYPIKVPPTLSVAHDQPGSDSPCVTLALSGVLLNTAWSTLVQNYRVQDDVMAAPSPGVESFLRQHTSPDAVSKLPAGAVTLFDDYVHDSRCWFRVPYFHEYAPGGYGFPRVVFAGGDKRKAYLGLASNAAPLDLGDGKTQAGWA
ncbi:T6SS phospholipase effector Tle1-like catalytic domain-containing protein [Burkholderia guangdongensis]|uniref:T6SS phospholipase effector Tle1-like catalytic domain-containing protein n=1 Tax=Burkholderia guangdongensis TaxID=1792500 RepID=UPI0015CE42D8|nr:DUF2235 domain-containing protein [Burkholderia guangdongensis]